MLTNRIQNIFFGKKLQVVHFFDYFILFQVYIEKKLVLC